MNPLRFRLPPGGGGRPRALKPPSPPVRVPRTKGEADLRMAPA